MEAPEVVEVRPPLIATLFWDLMRWPQSVIWVVSVGLTSGVWTLLLNRAFQGHNRLPQDTQKWLNRFMLRSAVAGFVWGVFVITDAYASDTSAIVGGASLIGLGAIVVSTLSYYPPVHRAFTLGLFSPFIVWALLVGSPTAQVMAGLAAGGMLYTMRASRNLGAMIVESLNTRFENLELIAQLKVQKELVEATRDAAVRARDAAEGFAEQAVQANQAKSRFLAAASHDLRQPVHALGLFAAAARTHVQGDEGHAIMDKIAASIDSTEALFNALLDVSRLDAGIMLPDVQPFALDDLLRRLVDEYAPRAAPKGLKLRWRPSGKKVSSDPALLERVLRNYLSNAIRYTATRPASGGAVLVACRTRGAALQALHALDRTPDVILCDYRLQGVETGIAVIKHLRQALGPITAALITGDTAPDRLLEATQSGLPLLHKPLNALQLKTSLCKLLAQAQQSSACRSDTFL